MNVSRELDNTPLTDTITMGQYEIKRTGQLSRYNSDTDKLLSNGNSTKH